MITGEIFVFGSNLAGRHGAGAAKTAHRLYGAEYGVGEGLTGRSYAIPTKGYSLVTLPLDDIEHYVIEFVSFALFHPELQFQLTAIGTGFAGYTPSQIAPLFANAPPNVNLPIAFKKILGK